MWKFAIVAFAGFLCNETVLTVLLKMQLLPDAWALCVSTAIAAILTFVLSKCWAFQKMSQMSMRATVNICSDGHE